MCVALNNSMLGAAYVGQYKRYHMTEIGQVIILCIKGLTSRLPSRCPTDTHDTQHGELGWASGQQL